MTAANRMKQEVLLEVRDLVKHFPIRQGIIFTRQVGGRCRRSMESL